MIVLLQPPFLRCAGSHNDRAPLELCYASTALQAAGIEHVVLNADATGTPAHVPWRRLFDQFELFQDAVDGWSALYSETFERVMQYDPEAVVVASGDSVIPVLDCGNPWMGVRYSQMFHEADVLTVGVGPFFGSTDRFSRDFDAIVAGLSPMVLTEVVGELQRREVAKVYDCREPPGFIPEFGFLQPAGQVCDYVMTAFGCPYQCDYCYAPKVLRAAKQVPVELVEQDLKGRGLFQVYVRDMIFPLNVSRLRELAPVMKGRSYTCDARADLLTPVMMEALCECGVDRLKLGVEVLDDKALEAMKKGEGAADIKRGVALAREFEMKVVLYVLLGGAYCDRVAYDRTYDFVAALRPEALVVNVASYQTFDRHYRYDSHFSAFAAMQWRVGDVLRQFLDLQEKLGNQSLKVVTV